MKGPYRLAGPASIECDIVVIGSGAGGAVVGEALARAGRDVLMLEEGPAVPAAEAPDTQTRSMARLWRGGGLTVALGRTPVAYAEGRAVGGGTEINSAIMQRAPDEVLEIWRKRYDIEEFGALALRPYYDRVLEAVNASITPGRLGPPTDVLRRAGERLGWEVTALERAQRSCVGTNFCAMGCPTGAKQSMTASYIPRALGNGMRLVAECRVTGLVRKTGRVVGVRAMARGDGGQNWPVRVRCNEVFLCAGAVHSAALLRRNGFTHRIGKTLRMHPTVKLIARFKDEMRAHEHRLPLSAITEFMPDIRLGGSLFSPGFFGMAVAEDRARRHHLLPDWRHCGIYYAMVRGRGIGTITPLPGIAEPVVRYGLANDDWRDLSDGALRLAEALFAAGAEEVFPSVAGHPGWRATSGGGYSEEAVLPRRGTNLISIHLFSSCPPGENRDLCATDSFGRLRGCENVTVADASQIPEAPGVNPQATIMALALRNAEAFLAR